MKRIFFLFMVTLFAFAASAQTLQPVWATPRVLKTPESVYYRAKNNRIYVSNINGKPAAEDGNGFISLLNENGKIIKLKWATGLNGPKGMAVKGNHLYVSDINRLAEIDLRNGKIIRYIPFPSSKFLNDVVLGPDGKIYVTDTGLGAVFVLKDGKPCLWSTNPLLKGANGLAIWKGNLLIGANGHLLEGNPKTGKLYVLARVPRGIDGLVPLGNGKYIVSDWFGEIRLIFKQGRQVVLSNTTSQHINAADLGFVASKKIILIPTFYNNRVIAGKLTGL